ncbi:hypothetical protein [Dactylosporangium sp. CS-033363]|uniref:hypothetical protein n=1 Tax=Dactylosporangium sp. CS-033363 TaxID=3239935 RepID=UPI003D8F94A0
MTMWQKLSPEQYAVMINAYENGYLNGVITDYDARRRRELLGDPQASSNLDDDGMRRLIPRFARVVADMIERGWIEIREPHDGRWDSGEPMSPAKIRQTLKDERTWIIDTQNYEHRMVMLVPGDRWEHVGRKS